MFFDPDNSYLPNDTLREQTSSYPSFSVFQYASLMQPAALDDFLFASGDGTPEHPYTIETESQLRAFAQSLSDDTDYRGIYIELACDIHLTAGEWLPAGRGNHVFRGHFDGQCHTISGLKLGTATSPYYDMPGQSAIGYFGLFSVLETDAVVCNLNLEVAFYVASGQSLYVSGLAGYASQALIEQVHISGTIQGSTLHHNANLFVGGICASTYRQEIRQCSSSARIHAEALDGMAEAGGITGFQNRGVIAHCHCDGKVTGNIDSAHNGRAVLGGIAGVHAGTIINCTSTAAILSDCHNSYLGALAGWATGISSTIESCYCLTACRISTSEEDTCAGVMLSEPVGLKVTRGKNNFGVPYAGSLVIDVYGFDAEHIQEEIAALRLKRAI